MAKKRTFSLFLAVREAEHRCRFIFSHIIKRFIIYYKAFPGSQSLSGFRHSNSMSRGPQRNKKHLPKTTLMIQTYADYVLGKIGIEYHLVLCPEKKPASSCRPLAK